MEERHQESNDIKFLARMGKVRINEEEKTIRMPKGAVKGIKTWGRIDFLCNHRGWTLITN
jgi:hypothetical protein